MNFETVILIKEICFALLLCGLPLAFIVSNAVSCWKEHHRHNEVNTFIRTMDEQNRRARENNATIIDNAFRAMAKQKTLIVMQNDEGYLTVKSLAAAEKEEVREALKKQDKWRETEAGA